MDLASCPLTLSPVVRALLLSPASEARVSPPLCCIFNSKIFACSHQARWKFRSFPGFADPFRQKWSTKPHGFLEFIWGYVLASPQPLLTPGRGKWWRADSQPGFCRVEAKAQLPSAPCLHQSAGEGWDTSPASHHPVSHMVLGVHSPSFALMPGQGGGPLGLTDSHGWGGENLWATSPVSYHLVRSHSRPAPRWAFPQPWMGEVVC